MSTDGTGERRRRRQAERSGRIDLDATMAQWPVADPPTAPRPVVRPARPSLPGVATEPVLPPPGALVVGPLLELRRARAGSAPASSGDGATEARRSRRGGAVGDAPRDPEAVPDPAAPGPGDPDWEADLVRAAASKPRARRRPTADRAGAADRTGASERDAVVGSSATNRGPTPAPTTTPLLPAGNRRRGGDGADAGPLARLRSLRPTGRRGLLAAAAVLVVVLLVVVLLTSLLGGGEDPALTVTPVDEPPAQLTLGLTMEGEDGVIGGLVLGVDSARVSTVLLPSDLLLEVADAAQQPLSRAVSLGADPVRRGLEDTLLLRVDGVVLLDPGQLASMVDPVGGVVVDVTDEVVTDDVVVAAGPDQRLTGAQAVAYATLRVDGEPVEAGLARLGAVVDGLLAALPGEPEAAREVATTAGLNPSTGMDEAELGTLLAAAAARAADGSTQSVVLPTREVSAGEAVRRGVDDEAARSELSSRFAGAMLPVAAVGEVRVVVRNGVGTPGLAGAARDRLVRAGLRYTGGGNTNEFGQTETVVLVASQDADDLARGEAVALALGVSPDSLMVNSESMVDTDVVVVLGEDFAELVADDPPSTEPTPGDAP